MKHFICISCAIGTVYYKWNNSNTIITLNQGDSKVFDVAKHGTELGLLMSTESALLLGEAFLAKAPAAETLLTVDPADQPQGARAESVLTIGCDLSGNLQSPVMQMKFPITAQGSWSTDYRAVDRGMLTWITRQLNIKIIPSPV
jgi:hypothetical protein